MDCYRTIAELRAMPSNLFDLLWSSAQRCFLRTLLTQEPALSTHSGWWLIYG